MPFLAFEIFSVLYHHLSTLMISCSSLILLMTSLHRLFLVNFVFYWQTLFIPHLHVVQQRHALQQHQLEFHLVLQQKHLWILLGLLNSTMRVCSWNFLPPACPTQTSSQKCRKRKKSTKKCRKV